MSTRQWSWKLGEFAGIGVYMHATFLLLLGWVAMVYWTQGGTLAAALAAAQVGKPFGHEALKVVDDLRAAKPPEPPIGFVQAALSGLRSKGRGRRPNHGSNNSGRSGHAPWQATWHICRVCL